jgi:P pilus assembly chaperone PapD
VRRAAIALTALAMAASPAAADISVSRGVIIFESGASQRTIVVTNDGKDMAFVTAKVRAVAAPGEADEKLQADLNPAVLGLLATPSRFALEPGEQRGVKLMTIVPAGERDRVWRVQLAPVVGELKPGQSGVAFVIAYDALVIQRAANARPTLAGARTGRTLTLTNRGNSFVMVSSIEQCSAGTCTTVPGKRLYAGQAWNTQLPATDAPVTVTLQGVGNRKELLRL